MLLQRNDLRWSAGLVFSKAESKITEFGHNAFRTGSDGLFRYGEGEEFGAMYGARFNRECRRAAGARPTIRRPSNPIAWLAS